MTAPRFTDPLLITPDGDRWRTTRPISFDVGYLGSGLTVVVPAGTRTDLASIPRPLWLLLPATDPRYAAASVLHDYLYGLPEFTRVVADAIFYEALRALGVSYPLAVAMYLAVRLANSWRSVRP